MTTRYDIDAIRRVKSRSSLTLPAARDVLGVIKDCASLSSGTLATLTGHTDYETLDLIHGDFVAYVAAFAPLPGHQFRTWVEAWESFTAARLDRPREKRAWRIGRPGPFAG